MFDETRKSLEIDTFLERVTNLGQHYFIFLGYFLYVTR